MRALDTELRTYVEGAGPILPRLPEAFAQLLGTDWALAYTIDRRGKAYALGDAWASRARPSFATALREATSRHGPSWAAFDPERPSPWQRNQVVLLRDFEPTERTSFVDRGFPTMGIAGCDQLRVLLCDGPALVAWAGAFQVGAFDEEARASIQAIVPALQWRLQLEGWSVRSAALGAVIEAIPTPAFLLRDERTLLHANAAGERMLEEEGVAVLDALSRQARAKVATSGVRVTPVEASGLGRVCLVVLEGSSIVDAQHARVSCAAKRWGLTPRQCAILVEVSQGASNRAIAASLGISARTVEQHLTTIFEKAQVETRTELVVRALRGG